MDLFIVLYRSYKEDGLIILVKRIWSRVIFIFGIAKLRALEFLGVREIMTPYGIKIVPYWNDMTFNFYALGIYGKFFSSFLENQKDPFCFVDIGANQGLYSLIAAKQPSNKKVFSFEPVETTFRLLLANTHLNGATKIDCHNVAISDQCGPGKIAVPEAHSGGASLRGESFEDRENIDDIQNIDLITAREMEKLLPNNLKTIVKIDVEGMELTVIRELGKLTQLDQISDIYYEVDERWVDAAEIKRELETMGFGSFKKIGRSKLHYDVLASRIRP